MRAAARVLLTLFTALLATAAVLGFGISRTLSDEGAPEFTAAMQAAIQDPQVQQEIQGALRTGIMAAGAELASRAGPLAGLAGSGAEALADQASTVVPTPRFQSAWQEWVTVLWTGLAAAAEGTPDPAVQVNGADIVVEIEPLLAPLTGDSLAGSVSGILNTLGRGTTFTVTTGIDLERLLIGGGRLAQWDWLLAAAAVAGAALIVLLGRNGSRWLGLVLFLSAAGCATVAALLSSVSRRPSEQMPALSADVMTALTAPWVDTALRSALVLAVSGVLVLVIAVVLGARRSDDRRAA